MPFISPKVGQQDNCECCGQKPGLDHYPDDARCLEYQVEDLKAALTASWIMQKHTAKCKECRETREDVDADYNWYCDEAMALDHDWWNKRYDALGIPRPKFGAD